MELLGFGGDAEDGFAEAENAVGGGFEGLRGGIVRRTGDDDLQRMIREKRGGEAVGGGEEAGLRGDGGDGICAGRWRILEGLAADVEAAHGRGVGRTIEEAAAFGVTVTGDGE